MSIINETWKGRTIYTEAGRKGTATGSVAFCQVNGCHGFKIAVTWSDAKGVSKSGTGWATDSRAFPCSERLTPHPTEPDAFVITVSKEQHRQDIRGRK